MNEKIEIVRWLFYLIGIAINSWIAGYFFGKRQGER